MKNELDIEIKPKVLAVDDIRSNLVAYKAIFGSISIELHLASSGQEALDLALNNDYALILLDVQMPEMDGFEVATHLRSNPSTSHVPIIFITAGAQGHHFQDKGYKIGAADYIEKPIVKDFLLAKVSIFLRFYKKNLALDLQKRKTEITLSAIPDPVITVLDNKIMYMNTAASRLAKSFDCFSTPESIDALFGRHHDNLIKIKNIIHRLNTSDSRADIQMVELIFESSVSSNNHIFEFRIFPLLGVNDKYQETILIFHDISNVRSLSQELSYQAYHDPLTSCLNRRAFDRDHNAALLRNKRQKNKLAVALIDLDDFKKINDSAGHNAGDIALKLAANRINQCIRDEDILYRLGGDEFAVLMENVESIESLKHPSNRILGAFKKGFEINNDIHQMGVSIGIAASNNEKRQDDTSLLIQADLAMYSAKENGKNTAVFYTPNLSDNLHKKIRLDKELAVAITNQEFYLVYQPQIDVKTGVLCGMEALIRWQHPEKGLVAPGDFIGVLESTGLIKQVGAWVIKESCRQIRKWKNAGYNIPCVSVNVSPKQFEEESLPSYIQKCLDEFKIPSDLLGIEITENLFMAASELIESNLNQLHKMGCKISLDDFGTGFSSLNYLMRFPVDVIKIDQSFIRNLTKPQYQNMVSGIIQMAHGFSGMKIICEGVENDYELLLLREMGGDMYQGYLHSKPLLPHLIEPKLSLKNA